MAMASANLKRPRTEDRSKTFKKNKKVKRQMKYHSSSEDDSDGDGEETFAPVDIQEDEDEISLKVLNSEEDVDETEEQSDASEGSASATTAAVSMRKKKRNDPEAFATSISKILGSKLTTSKRADPVLSRSKDVSEKSKALLDAKLEAKARRKLRTEKLEALERGRIKDVLGFEASEVNTAEVVEMERRLRKTAQRGVIKLFNAVRAAQVKGEEAAKEARENGVVGIGKREEKVTEMSKQGFLDLIAGGGKSKPSAAAI